MAHEKSSKALKGLQNDEELKKIPQKETREIGEAFLKIYLVYSKDSGENEGEAIAITKSKESAKLRAKKYFEKKFKYSEEKPQEENWRNYYYIQEGYLED